MEDEAKILSTSGLNELERAQIAEVVEYKLKSFKLDELRNEVHDAGVRIVEIEKKAAVIHKVLIDEGSRDTVIYKINTIVTAEEKRVMADTEQRAFRRQILAAVVISVLLSAGALLWQASRLGSLSP